MFGVKIRQLATVTLIAGGGGLRPNWIDTYCFPFGDKVFQGNHGCSLKEVGGGGIFYTLYYSLQYSHKFPSNSLKLLWRLWWSEGCGGWGEGGGIITLKL